MAYYKNVSGVTKKFHGVTFNPGETHEIFKTISHPDLVLVPKPEDEKLDKPQVKNANKEAKSNGTDNN